MDRRHRLEIALDLVAGSGLRVERADAADWAEARLREAAPGEAIVLYHSIVWQYLPADGSVGSSPRSSGRQPSDVRLRSPARIDRA